MSGLNVHKNATYAEVDAENIGMSKNECYKEVKTASIAAKSNGTTTKDSSSRKIISALFLFIAILILSAVSACIAFAFEISKLKSEIASSQKASSFQQLNSSVDNLQNITQISQQLNTLIQQLHLNHVATDNRTQQIAQHLDLFYQEVSWNISTIVNQTQLLFSSLENPGLFRLNPITSCAALHPSTPSGYYWVRTSNGIVVYVYCDMTRSCGGVTGGWMRVAKLDMRNSSHQCLGSLRERTDSNIRTCVRNSSSAGCSSVMLSDNALEISKVCGKIIAYQYNSPDAFGVTGPINPTINTYYMDGVSLTHGNPRQHIWTFVAALDEDGHNPGSTCSCSNVNVISPNNPPPYVGTDYFCDTSFRNRFRSIFNSADPLWDGAGCGPLSTCCTFNNPPWFYKQLPEPTTNEIEMRLCRDEDASNEDIAIEVVEIYVQ